MFGKRRRAASNPPLRAPPSASASLAASKAFVKNQESNPNLSNAAAAAALRTHVTTPPPVGDTVTKRMLRRNSQSSNGSGQVQPRPGGLQRQTSSGSMTERTFRSPSPGRGSPADPNAPPVPAVPKKIPDTGAVHRRASSLEPLNRGGSPVSRGGGRGVSLDRGTGASTAGRGQRATSNLAQVMEDDQDGGNGPSVNFSRPMSPASAAKQHAAPQSGWFGGPKINQEAVQRMTSTTRPQKPLGATSMDLRNAQQSVQNAADRPVKTHQVARGVEGSRLSGGSMRAKPSGTAVESRSFLPASRTPQGPVDPKSPDAVFDPSTRTFVHKQAAMAIHREMHEEPEQPSHHYVAQHVEEHYPRHTPQRQPIPRTPSPVRHPARREEPPAQRRVEVAQPQIDHRTSIRQPEHPPTGTSSRHSHAEAAYDEAESEGIDDAQVQRYEQANTNRNSENAIQPTPIDVMVSPKFAQNQDSSYPRIPTPVVPTTTNTLAGEGHGSVRTSTDRGQSLSPPRNAHFAPVAIELAGIKHQPPPRSISPAKSALKSSPSVSRRGHSPVSQNGRLNSRGAPSEASDATSDGGSGKKRATRVSFEETPFIAPSTSHPTAETPAPSTGLGASKWSPSAEKDNEFEDFMTPRPALPSFGSVRDKERRPTADEAEKVTETVSSTPMTASVGSISEPLHTSSDHAIAGIISQDFAKKQTAMNDPLPPEVTSVEGSGYVSDSSDEAEGKTGLQKHGAVDDSSQILAVPEPKSLTEPYEEKPTAPSSIKETVLDVPEIALLPATPSPYERPEPKYQSLMIPGGWGDDDAPEVANRAIGPSATTSTTSTQAPAAPTIQFAPQPTTLHDLVTRDEDSSDDNSSIYSDAYEDISDGEGGFGSIDAVANSTVASSSSGLMFSKYADKSATEATTSGLRNETLAQDVPEPVTTPVEDWDAARQHWSGVNEARKQPQQAELPIKPSPPLNNVVERVIAAPAKPEEPRTERRIEPQPTPVQKTPKPPQPQATQQSSTPLKSALKKAATPQPAPAVQSQPQIRKTMRGPPPVQRDDRAAPQMRTSMRGPPGNNARSTEPQMRTSMRGANPSPRDQPQMRASMRGANPAAVGGAGLAASRHSMPPVEQKQPRGALQKRHIPASVQVANARPQSMPVAPAQRIAPVPTYDSDSDASASSFQKARGKRSGKQGGRYTMRASMRQDAAPTMRAAAPAPKTVRAISPPASPSPAIRKSMRPSSPTPEAPKSSKFSIRSLSPMGRFRSSKPIEAAPPMPTPPRQVTGLNKQPKPKAPAPQRTKPAFSSRFADSSDEDDDGRPSRFQSRFADSDDDEDLTPVRGIPKRAGEEDGDSTDLEEEADEPAMTKEMGATSATNGASEGQTNGARNGQGAILATGSLRDSKHAPLPSFDAGSKAKAKRGFFGMGKKKASAAPVIAPQPAVEPASPPRPTPAPSSDIPLPPQQQKRNQGLPLTPIDEDKDFGTPDTTPQSKKAPKLQRRSTPEWPLPPVPPIPDETRPMSSDGIAPRRPRFANRQASSMSNATAPDAPGRSVSYGRSGKPKKFQGLRRVFGLRD
ncbi:hypothetical protein CC86DRAFT_100500 [Ophiobolus disseminans]|uniref:Uncharacterized protein n=1 Tax=Ophiobolus disseminans TaxID=1469910 RepID=A0A6A6ZN26_9PLEO|nr:hypothetical protein CC86DRAFT_100500 [Ophiobolus disseminans]